MNSNLNSSLVCKRCGYDANPPGETLCEICQYPLEALSPAATARPDRSRLRRNWPWLAVRLPLLLGLLLLVGGAYLLWRSWLVTPKTSPTANSLPVSGAVTRARDLQLQNSIQEVKSVPAGVFNYGGAFLFSTLVAQGLNAAIAQAYPEFQLRYTEPLNVKPGTGTGIAMLIDKELSFSLAGRPLSDAEVRRARERGFELEQVPVGLDGIAFFVHPKLELKGLSVAQVQDIFLGKITNWSQVGGPNLAIAPISLDPKTTSSFQILFAGKPDAQVGGNVQILRDYTSCIRAVAKTPGAIAYASASSVVNQRSVKLLGLAGGTGTNYVSPGVIDDTTGQGLVNESAFRAGTYPLTRRIFVIIRRDGTIDEQAGVAYVNFLLTNQGQAILRKAGFVPVRLPD